VTRDSLCKRLGFCGSLLAVTLCEGLDHPDAGPLDVASAADQLRQATAQTIQLETCVKPVDFEEQMYGPEG
jgi:hypothetical protein